MWSKQSHWLVRLFWSLPIIRRFAPTTRYEKTFHLND